MKQTKIIMGMPITLEVVDKSVTKKDLNGIFSYFKYIDKKFSTYKATSEITAINDGRLKIGNSSKDMKKVFKLAEKTRNETGGFFDIKQNDKYDPSGMVKGWAIFEAFKILKNKGFKNFYIEAGGDIQVSGKNGKGQSWKVGIKNPFKPNEIVKAISVDGGGVATSGIYERGNHIYNSKSEQKVSGSIVSLTVIGPNIYEADRFATAAFAMGKNGINFIEKLPRFEGYMIDKQGIATLTSGFEKFVL